MGVVSKIPVKALFQDIAQKPASVSFSENTLIKISRRNPASCISAGFLPYAHSARFGRREGEAYRSDHQKRDGATRRSHSLSLHLLVALTS